MDVCKNSKNGKQNSPKQNKYLRLDFTCNFCKVGAIWSFERILCFYTHYIYNYTLLFLYCYALLFILFSNGLGIFQLSHKRCNKCHKDFMVSNLNLLLTHFRFQSLCICLAGVYIALSFLLTRLNWLYLPTILLSWSCLFRKFTFFCLEMSVEGVEGVFINFNFMKGKNYYNFSET